MCRDLQFKYALEMRFHYSEVSEVFDDVKKLILFPGKLNPVCRWWRIWSKRLRILLRKE